jgi:hypothetical protein
LMLRTPFSASTKIAEASSKNIATTSNPLGAVF